MKIGKLGMAVLACGMTAVCAGAEAGQRPVPAVQVEQVSGIEQTEPKSYIGTVNGSSVVDLVARVSGTLEKQYFKKGSMVNKGDLLFQIEDTVYDAKVKSAQAALDKAKSARDFAKQEYQRYDTLHKSNATSVTSYENAYSVYRTAEAAVKAAEAELILAQNDLSYTKVYAPVSGKIGRNTYDEGNYINTASGALATLVCFDPVRIRFSMSEADYFRHFSGSGNEQQLKVFRADGREFSRPLTLNFIDNRIDSATGTMMLEFTAANPDEELVHGGYVTVKFTERYSRPLPSVNIGAIMSDGDGHYVYVVGNDNTVEKRLVKIGEQIYDRQVITAGLKNGETVITGGLHKTAPGQKVNPVTVAAAAEK